MTEYISVKNFERFQHYKKRKPPWIKLYWDLWEDYQFTHLSDASKLLLIGLFGMASRYDNKIPNDPNYIKNTLRLESPIDLKPLIDKGFILVDSEAIA